MVHWDAGRPSEPGVLRDLHHRQLEVLPRSDLYGGDHAVELLRRGVLQVPAAGTDGTAVHSGVQGGTVMFGGRSSGGERR